MGAQQSAQVTNDVLQQSFQSATTKITNVHSQSTTQDTTDNTTQTLSHLTTVGCDINVKSVVRVDQTIDSVQVTMDQTQIKSCFSATSNSAITNAINQLSKGFLPSGTQASDVINNTKQISSQVIDNTITNSTSADVKGYINQSSKQEVKCAFIICPFDPCAPGDQRPAIRLSNNTKIMSNLTNIAQNVTENVVASVVASIQESSDSTDISQTAEGLDIGLGLLILLLLVACFMVFKFAGGALKYILIILIVFAIALASYFFYEVMTNPNCDNPAVEKSWWRFWCPDKKSGYAPDGSQGYNSEADAKANCGKGNDTANVIQSGGKWYCGADKDIPECGGGSATPPAGNQLDATPNNCTDNTNCLPTQYCNTTIGMCVNTNIDMSCGASKCTRKQVCVSGTCVTPNTPLTFDKNWQPRVNGDNLQLQAKVGSFDCVSDNKLDKLLKARTKEIKIASEVWKTDSCHTSAYTKSKKTIDGYSLSNKKYT